MSMTAIDDKLVALCFIRTQFNSRAKLVNFPPLSAPYQLKLSLRRGVIIALLSSRHARCILSFRHILEGAR
jgi:hypothetical protein